MLTKKLETIFLPIASEIIKKVKGIFTVSNWTDEGLETSGYFSAEVFYISDTIYTVVACTNQALHFIRLNKSFVRNSVVR